MNKLIKNLAIGMGSVAMASHLYAKTVTDYAGNTVEIPDTPKRIASLHFIGTIMLYELGVPIIGTSTLTKKSDSKPYIRSSYELFGVDFTKTGWANYGRRGLDLEQIKKSKPDLIIAGFYHQKIYDKLEKIAPTLLFDYPSNVSHAHQDLATWVGKEDIFNQKNAEYQKRLSEVKTQIKVNLSQKSFVYIRTQRSKLYIGNHYGSITKVAYDLGLQKADFVKQNIGQDKWGEMFSGEIIGSFSDTDYVFSTYRQEFSQDLESVYEGFDEITPGWRDFIKAYQNQNFLAFQFELVVPVSFKSYHYVLNEFKKTLN